MKKLDKRDIILEEIIRAYLESNLPIGSSQLNARVDIPASTIRVYFKKLSDEGVLTQLHVSGGRVPTDEAMKGYWLSHIDTKTPLYIEDKEEFGNIVEDFGLYCVVSAHEEERLDEIIKVDDRFLILLLGDERVVIDYDENVKLFLEDIKGVKLSNLKRISEQFGLSELNEKLKHLIATKVLFKRGEMTVFDMAKSTDMPFNFIADANFPLSLNEGLIFDDILPNGYMAVKRPAIFDGEQSQLFCLGELYTDFESFFTKAKER